MSLWKKHTPRLLTSTCRVFSVAMVGRGVVRGRRRCLALVRERGQGHTGGFPEEAEA